MKQAISRGTQRRHPTPGALAVEAGLVSALHELPHRRDLIDGDELRLIEQARAHGWSWRDIAAAYPAESARSAGWTPEGVRRRWLILNAKREEPTS